MTRSPGLCCLIPVLLAASVVACGPDYPTDPTQPTAAAAKAGKPGGGSGGASGIPGQLLGTAAGSRANAVNASYVVGRDAARATAWNTGGQAVTLPLTGSASASSALGINAASVIVGAVDAAAVVWQPVSAGVWSAAATLPAPPGTWSSLTAHAVNDQGLIAGTGTRSDNLRFALRWSPAVADYSVEVVDAPGAEYEFVGYSIANGTGWVAGWVRRNVGGTASKDAFVWTSTGSFRLLGRLGGAATEARGINGAGRVVGWSAAAPRGGDSSPVTWTCTETACSAPAVLPMFYRNLNLAMSIDDAGDIVGTSGLDGILYSRCGPTVTLGPPAGWHQSYGWAVSGDGTAAAGYSFLDSGTMQATRWSLPAPAC